MNFMNSKFMFKLKFMNVKIITLHAVIIIIIIDILIISILLIIFIKTSEYTFKKIFQEILNIIKVISII